ncbi:sigma-70 family RNA polymerase sigma factor [Nocardioides sp. KIGAM211]|uniref:Sigma-70 family RNA polymerase sigma factor n=1 Tax=Nocardioides luti TaxID=2761101 RepID=A0A7X0VDC4_9ACTN|nr:sigma-70 family RNA polymerase sigma factor [Nocardioides luti]MBB6629158.1 sigma-70 family RNA polymerase sigma factor [Nocardioides luti]
MSTLLSRIDGPGDAELISAVRGGDVDAYGELYARHVEAARRLGRQLVPGPDVDDLVSEAFAKVLVVLQRGGGPDLAFRAYLLTAVRRLHVDRIRATSRVHPTDDLTPFDPGVPFRDTAVEGFENAAAARAFASLPERWQLVLWHTEVEGQKPADVAPLLGMSANSVSALAYRAREGLRQAFLSMHAQAALEDTECAWTHEHLGAYVRTGLSRRDARRIEEHLDECHSCLAIHLELTEVNSRLSGVLAPLLLGTAGAAYAAHGGGAAVTGGLAFLLGRARDLALANLPATAAAGVAAGAVVAGSVFVAVDRPSDAGTDPVSATPSADTGVGRDADRSSGPADRSASPAPADPQSSVVGSDGPAPAVSSVDPSASASDDRSGSPTNSGNPEGVTTGSPQSDTPAGKPDLAVTASPNRSSGNAQRVLVQVTGLPGGSTATLDVDSDHQSAVVTTDGGCSPITGGHGSCSVSSTPASYSFLVAVPENERVTVTFTVTPDGTTDAAPADNRVSVVLTP